MLQICYADGTIYFYLQFTVSDKTPLKNYSDILLENLKLIMPPKKPGQKKAANGYKMPDPIPAGKSCLFMPKKALYSSNFANINFNWF